MTVKAVTELEGRRRRKQRARIAPQCVLMLNLVLFEVAWGGDWVIGGVIYRKNDRRRVKILQLSALMENLNAKDQLAAPSSII